MYLKKKSINECQLISIKNDKYFCPSSSTLKAVNHGNFIKLVNKSDYFLCLNLFTTYFSKKVLQCSKIYYFPSTNFIVVCNNDDFLNYGNRKNLFNRKIKYR